MMIAFSYCCGYHGSLQHRKPLVILPGSSMLSISQQFLRGITLALEFLHHIYQDRFCINTFMISHKYRFFCPAIGKNASSTLVQYFSDLDEELIDEGHESVIVGLNQFLNGKYFEHVEVKKYFIFAFVRNPFDRLVSAFYEYRREDQFLPLKKEIRNDSDLSLEKTLVDFGEFVEMTQRYEHIHWKSQYSITHENDQCLVHHFGKVESIKLDLNHLCNILDIDNKNQSIPFIRPSKGRGKVADYYNKSLLNKVRNVYHKDFDVFDYDETM